MPLEQGVHFESDQVEPALYPEPGGQDVTVCGSHAPLFVEKVPVVHSPVQVASSVVVPGTSGAPLLHVGVEYGTHVVLSSLCEYVPTRHGKHDASFVLVPAE